MTTTTTAPATPTEPTVAADAIKPGAKRPDVMHSDRPMRTAYLGEAAMALRSAWALYLALALLPPLAMIATIFFLIFRGGDNVFGPNVIIASTTAGWYWLLAGMLWISVAVPAAFFVRRIYWNQYYKGHPVGPGDYLKGNAAIWLPLVLAGVMGFVGFAATRYVASLFTSITAFIVYLSMSPNGHAMTRPVGDHDDPAVYEEPK